MLGTHIPNFLLSIESKSSADIPFPLAREARTLLSSSSNSVKVIFPKARGMFAGNFVCVRPKSYFVLKFWICKSETIEI